jgi:hypothetical protein
MFVVNADTYMYSILDNVQCAESADEKVKEKGKGKDRSQLPE